MNTSLQHWRAGGPHRPSHRRGFTLIEMMIVLAIFGILLSGAGIGLGSVVERWKLSAASYHLASHLHLARSEAIKRNARVAVCKSSDGRTCSTAGTWDDGWLVFHDANNNGTFDPGETLVQRGDPLPPYLRVLGNQPVANYVSYTGAGATLLVSGAFQAGTITICRISSGPTDARQIIINAVGRPRLQAARVDSCA